MGVRSVLAAGLGAKPDNLLLEGTALSAQVMGRLVVLPVLELPIAVARWLGVEDGTDNPRDAALLVVPSPLLEGWAMCLGHLLGRE